MSIIARLRKEKEQSNGFFCAVGGVRMAGKSTLAGTLPGKTLLIQPKGIEAGGLSPVKLAQKHGNQLDLIEILNYKMLFEVLQDSSIKEYDNIYVDGVTALTEMVYRSDEFEACSKKNKWDGFDLIKNVASDALVALKQLAETENKNTFITYALENKYNANGTVSSVEIVAKGNATKSLIEGKGSAVVIVSEADETGDLRRGLVTKNRGPYSARVGDILDNENPGVIGADLGELLKLAGRL